MRVGFLFNHNPPHQVAHNLPVALALARRRPDIEVIIATTSAGLTEDVLRHCPTDDGRPSVVQLGLGPATRFLARRFGRLFPAIDRAIYRANLPFFRSLDALVVTEDAPLPRPSIDCVDGVRLIHTSCATRAV